MRSLWRTHDGSWPWHLTAARKILRLFPSPKERIKDLPNSMLAEQGVLDKVLLRSLADALHEQVLDRAIEQALAKVRTQQDTQLDRCMQIERELSLIEAIEKRLVDGIAKGESMDPLLTRLRAEEERKKTLIAELGQIERKGMSEWDVARLKRELRERIAIFQPV